MTYSLDVLLLRLNDRLRGELGRKGYDSVEAWLDEERRSVRVLAVRRKKLNWALEISRTVVLKYLEKHEPKGTLGEFIRLTIMEEGEIERKAADELAVIVIGQWEPYYRPGAFG